MRSTRMAMLAVAVGAGLLGWSTARVTAVGSGLSAATPQPADLHDHDLDVRFEPDRGHHRGPGV